MKILKMNKRFISLVVLVTLVMSVTRCIKDDKDDLIGVGPKIIRVDAGPDKLVVVPTITSSVTLAQVWRDATSTGSLAQAVSVNFSTDPQIVLDHNAANPDDIQYTPLPPQYFSFSPTSLNFDAGVFNQTIGLTMNGAGLDLSKDYAIGLVSSADGWTPGGDKFIKIALPSAYEGDYKSTGTR